MEKGKREKETRNLGERNDGLLYQVDRQGCVSPESYTHRRKPASMPRVPRGFLVPVKHGTCKGAGCYCNVNVTWCGSGTGCLVPWFARDPLTSVEKSRMVPAPSALRLADAAPHRRAGPGWPRLTRLTPGHPRIPPEVRPEPMHTKNSSFLPRHWPRIMDGLTGWVRTSHWARASLKPPKRRREDLVS